MERVSYKVINFRKWLRHFHQFPAHNNKFRDESVISEIQAVLGSKSLNDAVLFAKKFVDGEKRFVDIHPFDAVFRAAIQDCFIKDEHPECVRVPSTTSDQLDAFDSSEHQTVVSSDLEIGFRYKACRFEPSGPRIVGCWDG